jgi:hypothetical protein
LNGRRSEWLSAVLAYSTFIGRVGRAMRVTRPLRSRSFKASANVIVASTLVGHAIFLVLNRSTSSLLANSFNYGSSGDCARAVRVASHEPVCWSKTLGASVTLIGVAIMVGARTTGESSPVLRPSSARSGRFAPYRPR